MDFVANPIHKTIQSGQLLLSLHHSFTVWMIHCEKCIVLILTDEQRKMFPAFMLQWGLQHNEMHISAIVAKIRPTPILLILLLYILYCNVWLCKFVTHSLQCISSAHLIKLTLIYTGNFIDAWGFHPQERSICDHGDQARLEVSQLQGTDNPFLSAQHTSLRYESCFVVHPLRWSGPKQACIHADCLHGSPPARLGVHMTLLLSELLPCHSGRWDYQSLSDQPASSGGPTLWNTHTDGPLRTITLA